LLTLVYSLPSAAVAKTILHGASGSSTKFSWVLVDAEHGLISDTHYYEVCPQIQPKNTFIKLTGKQLNNAIGSEDASPVVRVPCAEEWMIKRALDAGAHGIMTPMCHSEVFPSPKQLPNHPRE
jgi:4-hydroxy-2-oxoheptanedioate aldolase